MSKERSDNSPHKVSEGEEVELDCGDNSCYFAKKAGGMRTNGGCRCFENAGFHRSTIKSAHEMLPKYLALQAKLSRAEADAERRYIAQKNYEQGRNEVEESLRTQLAQSREREGKYKKALEEIYKCSCAMTEDQMFEIAREALSQTKQAEEK